MLPWEYPKLRGTSQWVPSSKVTEDKGSDDLKANFVCLQRIAPIVMKRLYAPKNSRHGPTEGGRRITLNVKLFVCQMGSDTWIRQMTRQPKFEQKLYRDKD